MNNKKIIIPIIVLVMLIILTGYYAFTLREEYNNMKNNNYTEAFSNLVNYVNSIENYLAKAMISRSPTHAAETLTHVWRDSNLAIVYLSRIPLENDGLSQTAKFLNQVSDYSYSLSKKNISGTELKEEDFRNLEQLYQYSLSLEETLNQLSEEIYMGDISWDSLNANVSTKFAQSVDSISVFSNIDDNLNDYEGLIYDGAYSDHINKMEKLGLTGDDINEETAKRKVEEFLEGSEIEKIELNAFLGNADIPSYDFLIKLKNREENYNVMVSKKVDILLKVL